MNQGSPSALDPTRRPVRRRQNQRVAKTGIDEPGEPRGGRTPVLSGWTACSYGPIVALAGLAKTPSGEYSIAELRKQVAAHSVSAPIGVDVEAAIRYEQQLDEQRLAA